MDGSPQGRSRTKGLSSKLGSLDASSEVICRWGLMKKGSGIERQAQRKLLDCAYAATLSGTGQDNVIEGKSSLARLLSQPAACL